MNSFLSLLPRANLAALAREVLAKLAVQAEGAASNQILHNGEVFIFSDLDALLAKIEAEPAGS
jgi:hypothetical protein